MGPFQVWGGGGPWAGVCCCPTRLVGGSGSHGRRIIEVAPRTIYNLCRWINLLSPRCYPVEDSLCMWTQQFLYVFHEVRRASKCFWSPTVLQWMSNVQLWLCKWRNTGNLWYNWWRTWFRPRSDMHPFMPAHPRNDTYVLSGCYKTHGQDHGDRECPGGGGATV